MRPRMIRVVRWSVLATLAILAYYFLYGFLLNVWRTALPGTSVHPEPYISKAWISLGLFLVTVLAGTTLFLWLRKRK
jgi:hypothetical protein